MATSTGMPAIVGNRPRALILGSLPGRVSLSRREYYANPGNAFWWIMGELFGALPALPYPDRVAALHRASIAVWDVCETAERHGSLDSSIVPTSVVANDIAALLIRNPTIAQICFNGAAAEKLFRRHVLARATPPIAAIPRTVLISTSPACTIRRPEKLARWRHALAGPP